MSNKVLVLASVASMIEQFNMSNIEILIDLGYEVHVACNFIDGGTIPSKKVLKLKENLTEMNVSLHQIDFDRNAFNLKETIKSYGQTLELFRKENFMFVHCHSPIGGVCARIVGKKTNTKVIYTAHGFHFFDGAPLKNWLLYYPVEKILSKYTSKLLVINEEDLRIANEKFNARMVEYVPGVGVDITKFYPISHFEKEEIRGSLGIDSETYVIVYVGELSNRKNQIMLLESARELESMKLNFKIIIIGGGSKKQEYSNYIEKYNLTDYVELTGYSDDIATYMSASDLAISTSKQEGLPVNIMEAMAIGLPVIATNCRGNKDLVLDQKNGFIVNIGDVSMLTKRIIQLKDDAALNEKFRENNLQRVKMFSKSVIDIEMRRIYKDLKEV